VDELGVDLLTLSSNDIYGPRGVGALYIRKKTKTYPMIQGGGQERGMRSGTENVAGIVGYGEAVRITSEEMPADAPKLQEMRDRIIEGVLSTIDDVTLNGHPEERTPHNANLRFAYVEGEAVLLHLADRGIATATSSACTSKTLEPSHVLIAMGIDHASAQGALLLSVGRFNTPEDVGFLLEELPGVIENLRRMSPLYQEANE
jgi:cysteine desulfurase